VIYEHVLKLQLEAVSSVHALHPANTDCAQCKWSGRVPMSPRAQGQGMPSVQRPWMGEGAHRRIEITLV
jgi:hypothetical protein